MEIIKSFSTESNHVLEPDCWSDLKKYTDARIALGRTGASLPTDEILKFGLSHARAKDTIHMPFDREALKNKFEQIGQECLYVSSAAPNRSIFLTRPDLGRKLSDSSRQYLEDFQYPGADIALVVGDGLSSKAVHNQVFPLVSNLLPYISELGLSMSPLVLAEQSRVALGDEIGALLRAKLVAILIGERPGLSSPDSLGVYITWNPYVGRLESDRNCISNIRPEGLSFEKAAFKMAWIIENAFRMQQTGIHLKDMSDNPDSHKLIKPRYFIDSH